MVVVVETVKRITLLFYFLLPPPLRDPPRPPFPPLPPRPCLPRPWCFDLLRDLRRGVSSSSDQRRFFFKIEQARLILPPPAAAAWASTFLAAVTAFVVALFVLIGAPLGGVLPLLFFPLLGVAFSFSTTLCGRWCLVVGVHARRVFSSCTFLLS